MKSVILGLLIVARCAVADETPASLAEIIRAAEKTDSALTASHEQAQASDARVSVRGGDYLPSLELDAADSWGYAGSSSSLAVPGIAGSPFREGVGGDLLLSGTIWDFGRTSARVRSAEHDAGADRADIEVNRGDIDREAVALYLECARYRSHLASDSFVAEEATRVDREVQRFVSIGQRSIVDKYLSRAQVEQAETDASDFDRRLSLCRRRLSVLTAIPENRIDPADINTLSDASVVFQEESNPIFAREDEKARASSSQVEEMRSDYLPKVKGYASAGMLEDSHILPKQDYAVALGVTLPLFDGFKTVNGVKEAEAEEGKRRLLSEDARERVDQANARYDQAIESTRSRLKNLEAEVGTVKEGFSVAKSRYFSLHGTLVDLREALRNLASVQNDIIDTRAALLAASLEKKLFNGWRLRP